MAAVSFSGLNRIDFGAIIDATINAESIPLNMLKQRQTDIQSRDSALLLLSGGMSTMETHATALVAESLFPNSTANSNNAGVGSATAGSDAVSGTYSLHVDKLAKALVTASTTGLSATDAIIADGGSVSFTINGTTTTSIDITAGTSLLNLRNSISAQKIAAAQARLDLRKKQLQKQFAAADEAISKLNAMTGQLSQLGSSKLF